MTRPPARIARSLVEIETERGERKREQEERILLEGEPKKVDDTSIFDRGEGARKEPMTLAQLEAKIPEWNAKQRKTKLKPIVVYTREMHRALDAGNAAYRKRAAGSETARRSQQRLGRIVGDHGAHSIRGLYGTPKDALPDAPAPTYQAAKEVAQGYCHHCHKAIPRAGNRPDTKFCPDKPNKPSCKRAFQYREKLRNEANKHFADYRQSLHAKAEAELARQVIHGAVKEMTASAARAGIDGASFMATPAGVLAPAGIPLPPIRCLARSWVDHPRLGAVPKVRPVEVTITPAPEYGAMLYAFDFPPVQDGDIGLVREIEVRFMGDLGGLDYDGYPTPEQEAESARLDAQADAEFAVWRVRQAERARRERARIARGGPNTTSARQQHADERMRNLLARPDHDRIIAEMEADGCWDDLRDFYRARGGSGGDSYQ